MRKQSIIERTIKYIKDWTEAFLLMITFLVGKIIAIKSHKELIKTIYKYIHMIMK
jgi:hypothetical protein